MARALKISPALKKRAAQISLILMDVDGTMTDGSVTLLSQNDGSALEIKTFDAHDGQGLTLAQTAGLRTGCITGRESAALLLGKMGVEVRLCGPRTMMPPAPAALSAPCGPPGTPAHPPRQ